MPSADHPPPLPPPLLYLATVCLAIALSDELPIRLPCPTAVKWAGVAVIGMGQLLSFWAMWRFRRQRTSPSNFSQPAALLQTGPFGLSRNPVNLGDTLAYIGLGLLMGSLWPWLLLPALLGVMNRWVIRPDEQQLLEEFGETYRQYCRRVRRWI